MVQKSRNKIILSLSLTFAFFIAVIICLLYFYLRSDDRADMQALMTNHFRILAEEVDGTVDPEAGAFAKGQKKEVAGDDYSVDRQRELIYVLRTPFGEEEAFEIYERAGSGTLTDEEILSIGDSIYALERLSGTWENYAYSSTIINDSLHIAFVDMTEIIREEHGTLLKFIVAGLILLAVLTGVSVPVSAVLVKPLEESIRRQSEFIRMAEHELKTPLAVMQTSLSMLKEEGTESKYLDYALTENEKMKHLVAEMLDLSRAEGQGKLPDLQEVDLSACVEGAVLPFEAAAFESNVTLETEIRPGLSRKADPVQMDRLVGILLDNAIKHTEPGGRILVTLTEKELTVRNQGEPIPSEERSRIFEPFYRVDKAGNREQGRYGLGLSIAASIAAAHRAELKAEYEDGYTVFRLIFC